MKNLLYLLIIYGNDIYYNIAINIFSFFKKYKINTNIIKVQRIVLIISPHHICIAA